MVSFAQVRRDRLSSDLAEPAILQSNAKLAAEFTVRPLHRTQTCSTENLPLLGSVCGTGSTARTTGFHVGPGPHRSGGDVHSLRQKLTVYRQQLAGTEYGRANLAIMSCVFGLGLANAGYMLLLDVLGGQGSSLPVLGLMGVSALSSVVAAFASVYGSHRRDNQDLPLYNVPVESPTLENRCNRLILWSLGTAGQNALLLLATYAHSRKRMSASALMSLSIVTKTAELSCTGMEQAFWDCIKPDLGAPHDRQHQRQLSRTIVAFEQVFVATTYNLTTVALYFSLASSAPHQGRSLSHVMWALGVGGMVALLPKYFFWRLGRRPQGDSQMGIGSAQANVSAVTQRPSFPARP